MKDFVELPNRESQSPLGHTGTYDTYLYVCTRTCVLQLYVGDITDDRTPYVSYHSTPYGLVLVKTNYHLPSYIWHDINDK